MQISIETLVFWLILDPITFGLGSIGAYLLFKEYVNLDHSPSLRELLPLALKHWKALGALAVAILYFFYRLFTVLNR